MMHALILHTTRFQAHIQQVTGDHLLKEPLYPTNMEALAGASAVLFLLGFMPSYNGHGPEPSLILNKRSQHVKQPGDLCCPGGGISAKLDTAVAKTMALPGLPMWRWPFWKKIKSRSQPEAEILRLLVSTSIRESYEEMRLSPFGVRFLGPLPTEHLVMFERVIYPMVGWVARQQHFRTNWEVEKIVSIPIRALLNPENYVRYLLEIRDESGSHRVYDAPSYVHKTNTETEVLWGATCRMTLSFLELVFDFSPPTLETLPVLKDKMDRTYLHNGKQA
jgi:hypothetical protein